MAGAAEAPPPPLPRPAAASGQRRVQQQQPGGLAAYCPGSNDTIYEENWSGIDRTLPPTHPAPLYTHICSSRWRSLPRCACRQTLVYITKVTLGLTHRWYNDMQRELILVEGYEEFYFSIRETLLLQTSNKADPSPASKKRYRWLSLCGYTCMCWCISNLDFFNI